MIKVKNKYLITILIPDIEYEFDVYIPSNKKVGTIKKYLYSAINELTNGAFKIKDNVIFIDRDNGITYDNDKLIKDSGIKNGTKIVLIQ